MGLLGTLIPLVILGGFIAAFAWVGYEMYIYSNTLADRGKKHLEKKNIVYTKDGVRVGVKEKTDEQVNDRVQSGLVKTWNLAGESGSKPSASRTNSGSRPTTSRSKSGTS